MVYQRVAIVDEMIRRKGWSLATANELALTMNVSRSTVYRLRNMATAWTRKHLRPTNIEAFRLQQVVALSDIAMEARENKDYGAAVRAVRTQAEIIGTIAAPGVKVDVNIAQNVTLSAAIARVSALEPEQLEERRRLAMEATFVEVPRVADAETVPVEPADVPSRG